MINHRVVRAVMVIMALLMSFTAGGGFDAGAAPAAPETGQVMLVTVKKSAGRSAIEGLAAQPGLRNSLRPS